MSLNLSSFNARSIGQDSEFFLWDDKKDEVVPSFKYFPKKADATAIHYINPTEIPLKEKYTNTFSSSNGPFLIFRDGLAVEVNTPPGWCRETFWNNVRHALILADSTIPDADEVQWTDRPWVKVSEELMKTFPSDVRELGCHPTLDAYTQSERVLDVNGATLNFRTSGSHLHMAIFKEDGAFEDLPTELWSPFIKAADLLLGVPFTFIFHDELEVKRRQLYGRAGEFRFQRYPLMADARNQTTGLEYRVLSSRLWSHVGLGSLFVGIWKFILGNGERLQQLVSKWDPAWEDDICEAINTADPKALERAMNIMVQNYPQPSRPYRDSYDNPLIHVSDFGLTPDEMLSLWKKLAKARELQMFKDTQILNMQHPGGIAMGWREFSKEIVNISL